jgi:predicted DNA-binding transcriptional regulator AlpA
MEFVPRHFTLDAKATAAYLAIPEPTLFRLVKRGVLPQPRIFSGRKSWSASEIDAVMSGAMPPVTAPSPPLPKKREQPERIGVQHPQELLSAETIIISAVPLQTHGSGIYFLIKGGAIVYVGQSINVPARISTHAAEKVFDSWHWIPCPRKSLDLWERLYLNALLPPLNRDQETLKMARAKVKVPDA